MTPPDLKEVSLRLRDHRERTLARIESFKRSFEDIVASSEGSPPDDEHDPEGTTIGWERAQITSLLREAEAHLVEIEGAELRIVEGTYGTCQRCGRAIGPERLAARPTARTCVNCAANGS